MRRPIITILALLLAYQACTAAVKAPASVVDCGTLWGSGVKTRLNGIDAPARNQTQFWKAAEVLKHLVATETVTCSLSGERSHERYIGICYAEEADLTAA